MHNRPPVQQRVSCPNQRHQPSCWFTALVPLVSSGVAKSRLLLQQAIRSVFTHFSFGKRKYMSSFRVMHVPLYIAHCARDVCGDPLSITDCKQIVHFNLSVRVR